MNDSWVYTPKSYVKLRAPEKEGIKDVVITTIAD